MKFNGKTYALVDVALMDKALEDAMKIAESIGNLDIVAIINPAHQHLLDNANC